MYTYNPFTSNLDIAPSSEWREYKNEVRTTTGAGLTIASIPIPDNTAAFFQIILMGKLEGADQYYVELITHRFYKPVGGNAVQLSGGTASLSENFTVNPVRAVSAGANYVLQVTSGGVQDVNWEILINYHFKTFNL